MANCGISVSKIQLITGCNYQKAIDLYNRILDRDNDRYEQLEQVAKEMWWCIEFPSAQEKYRERLEALGVSLDD